MAGNYRGGYRGGNNSGNTQKVVYSPEQKLAYYQEKAEKEQDPIAKARYAEKAQYWGMRVENKDIPPELEASCGEKHEMTAADQLINAKRWLNQARNDQKKAEWQFKVNYWTKKANGQEVSPKEEEMFAFYESQGKVQRQNFADNKKMLPGYLFKQQDVRKELSNVKNSNAVMLAKSLVRGDFPAFGEGRKPGSDGKIHFVPVSARCFENGEAYQNLNQLILQLYIRERGLTPDPETGHVYFATSNKLLEPKAISRLSAEERRALGDNLKPGAMSIRFSTVGSVKTVREDLAKQGVDFDKLSDEQRKSAFKSSEKLYTVYPAEDVKDVRFTVLAARGGPEQNRGFVDTNSAHAVDASDTKNALEFLAKYDIACHYGREFVCTPEKIKEVQNELRHNPDLEKAITDNYGAPVLHWFKGGNDYRRELYRAEGDKFRNLNPLSPEEMAHLTEEMNQDEGVPSGKPPVITQPDDSYDM